MLCLGILWSPMNYYVDEVMNDVSSYGNVIDNFSMDLGELYESFVREIYAQDEIAEWKVDKKVETMCQNTNSNVVNILFMDINIDDQYFHPFKKRNVYTNLENMKTNIRKKYSEKITNYFFDNTFHVTDDEREFVLDYAVIEKFVSILPEKSKKEYVKKKGI